MNQFLPLLGKALNIEGFAVGEEGSSLSLEQLKNVEAALSAKDQRIAELADELAAVKKSPADSSTAVINEGTSDKHQPQDGVKSYVETCNQAKALYNRAMSRPATKPKHCITLFPNPKEKHGRTISIHPAAVPGSCDEVPQGAAHAAYHRLL